MRVNTLKQSVNAITTAPPKRVTSTKRPDSGGSSERGGHPPFHLARRGSAAKCRRPSRRCRGADEAGLGGRQDRAGHSEERALFTLFDAGGAGLELTESCAMTPAAAVRGFYLAHPARYFAIGRIGHDQLHDYATRKNTTPDEMERWLRPHL